jgi:hypothetical protein
MWFFYEEYEDEKAMSNVFSSSVIALHVDWDLECHLK